MTMKNIQLPENWYGKPPTEWDMEIAKTFPYGCSMRREYFSEFDEIILFLKSHCEKGSFTWKGPKFFFKNEYDATMFKMKWS